MYPYKNILFDDPFQCSPWEKESLVCPTGWLQIDTKVTVVGAGWMGRSIERVQNYER
jgi:hypothetical protein